MSAIARYLSASAIIAVSTTSLSARAERPDERANTVRVQPIAELPGDGRTSASIHISGGPAAAAGELTDHPPLPHVSCKHATVLPAIRNRSPIVLAPAVTRATTISCVANLRGAQTPLKIPIRPPKPGLYATLAPGQPMADDAQLQFRAFSLSDRDVTPPTALQVSASAGTLHVEHDGRFALTLPDERVPRIIAVVLADDRQFGAVFAPVTVTTKLPIRVTGRGQVRVRLGGREFGPVAVRKGRVRLPIHVPPGVTQAVVRVTDRVGNANESVANLGTPDAPRLAVLARQSVLPANTATQIGIALAGPRGVPAGDAAQIIATARRGTVGRVRYHSPGLWVSDYVAPSTTGEDEVTIRVAGDDGAGVAVVALRVSPALLIAEIPLIETAPDRLRPRSTTSSYHLDAHASAGWVSNGADVSTFRAGIGVQMSRQFWRVELALRAGVELMSFSDSEPLMPIDEQREVSRSVRALGVPVQVLARFPLHTRIGGWIALALVPTYARIAVRPDFQSPDEYTERILGQRLALGLDTPLPRGRMVLTLSLGRARLSSGPLIGHLERIAITAGYQIRLANVTL